MAKRSKLETYRADIDALDDELLKLLERRAQLARAVGAEKNRQGATVYAVPEREAQILRRQKRNSVLLKKHITAIYREIIAACLALEKPPAIAYLGPEGTFTHEAAIKMFGHAAKFYPAVTIADVIGRAEKRDYDFAVVPFENSTAGTVADTVDALLETPLTISGETVLRIRHNLLCADARLPLDQVRAIYAHPQALEQCRNWLGTTVPRAVLHVASSNAEAARLAAADKSKKTAAIASATAGEVYKLPVLAESIEDLNNNSTRFLILGRQRPAASGVDKTSFIMTVKDEAGEMYKIIKQLADNHINMVKLESRPLRGRLWEYLFFVDCVGHIEDKAMKTALESVRKRASFMKILGSYPQAAD